jgi:hypothetical protein
MGLYYFDQLQDIHRVLEAIEKLKLYDAHSASNHRSMKALVRIEVIAAIIKSYDPGFYQTLI